MSTDEAIAVPDREQLLTDLMRERYGPLAPKHAHTTDHEDRP